MWNEAEKNESGVCEEEYQKTLEYLTGLTRFGINLGLARMQELMRRLDHPENGLKVIHVGGTNGKGSTAVMIAEILREAGYRTGLFTSPHLHDCRERIVINGQMIPREALIAMVNRLRPHMEAMVAKQRESGLSGNAWCRREGISPGTFHSWVSQLKEAKNAAEEEQTATKTEVEFAVVKIAEQPTVDNMNLVLHKGKISIEVARGFCPKLLLSIIETVLPVC